MKKHAYMIIAHNEFELLEILVRLLDDPRNDIYIHIDAKVKNFDFAYFKQLVQKSKLEFTPRRLSVTWGHSSQVMTELLLLQTAVNGENSAEPYAYFHLLSGVDLPIKSNDEIHAFFAENQGKEFVNFERNTASSSAVARLRYYHLFRKKRNQTNKIFAQIVLRLQIALHVNRLRGKNLVIQKGTNWFSITRDSAKYILTKEAEIKKIFAYSYCADELLVQTLLINSPFKENLYLPGAEDDQLACGSGEIRMCSVWQTMMRLCNPRRCLPVNSVCKQTRRS